MLQCFSINRFGICYPSPSSSCAVLRFCTDPNIPGTEKIAVSEIKRDLLSTPHMAFQTSDICHKDPANFLQPMNIFLVKGWSRCVCMTTCLMHVYAEPEMLKAGQFPLLSFIGSSSV